MKKLPSIVLLMTLMGCAHVVPSDLRAEADKSLTIDALFSDPGSYAGKTVIVGGVIVETRNLMDGTEIEVLEKPLDSRGRPLDTDTSRGRFILIHPDRLDPAIFSPGREISAAAVVSGVEKRQLDDIQYPYAKLKSKAVYIHKTTASQREPRVHFGFGVFKSF